MQRESNTLICLAYVLSCKSNTITWLADLFSLARSTFLLNAHLPFGPNSFMPVDSSTGSAKNTISDRHDVNQWIASYTTFATFEMEFNLLLLASHRLHVTLFFLPICKLYMGFRSIKLMSWQITRSYALLLLWFECKVKDCKTHYGVRCLRHLKEINFFYILQSIL